MVGESNQNVFLIQIDASNFAEFEISEFEISRFDCTQNSGQVLQKFNLKLEVCRNGIANCQVKKGFSLAELTLQMVEDLNKIIHIRGEVNFFGSILISLAMKHLNKH